MLASYNGKKYLLVSLLAIILDGVISYYLPSYFNNINYIYPMFTVSLIPFLSKENSKKNILYIFVIGLIYNLLYSNIFLFHSLVFIMLFKINNIFLNIVKDQFISYVILVIINIIFYDSLYFILMLLTNYQVMNISDLIYKIKYSLPNVLSVFVYWFIIKKQNKLHKM